MPQLVIDRAAWHSRWRRRRVADKLVLCGGLLAAAVVAVTPSRALLIALLTITIALGAARVPPSTYLKAMTAPLVFIITGGVAIAVTLNLNGKSPSALWGVGPIAITSEGLATAGLVASRSLAASSALMLLATTTPVIELIASARRIRIPDPLLEITFAMYQFVFGLLGQYLSIQRAQAARMGYSNPQRARKAVAELLAVLLVRSWGRAERVERAWQGRGYAGSLTLLEPRRISSPRFLALSISVVAAAAAVALVPLMA